RSSSWNNSTPSGPPCRSASTTILLMRPGGMPGMALGQPRHQPTMVSVLVVARRSQPRMHGTLRQRLLASSQRTSTGKTGSRAAAKASASSSSAPMALILSVLEQVGIQGFVEVEMALDGTEVGRGIRPIEIKFRVLEVGLIKFELLFRGQQRRADELA